MFKFPATLDDRTDLYGSQPYEEPETAMFVSSTPEESDATAALLGALRQHAAGVLATCLDAEVNAYLALHAWAGDLTASPLVVRNGFQPVRPLSTSIGPVDVRPPKVRARVPGVHGYRSKLAPRYVRQACAPRPGGVGRYLHAFAAGNWSLLVADLLALQSETVLHLPTTSLDAGWRRDAPSLVVQSNPETAAAQVEGAWYVINVQMRAGEVQFAAAVVVRRNSAPWQLLACGIAKGSRDLAVVALRNQLMNSGFSSEMTAAFSNTKIDVTGMPAATFSYKHQ